MRIACGSDFHFEFLTEEIVSYIIEDWIFLDTDLLIIAGDLHVGADNVSKIINKIINTHNIPVIYVPGNHEYYNSSFEKENNKFRMIDIDMCHVLLNGMIDIDNIKVFGCVGNIDGSYEEISLYKHGVLNDFHLIKDFENHDVYGRRERNNLISCGEQSSIDIVVTHTMPSPKCVSEKYAGDYLNACFCNDWEREIHDISPKVWICGHTHDRFNMWIYKTKILANPMGYPHENKNWEWEFVEI